MKETYISPVLTMLCLASREQLANSNEVDFDSMLGGGGGGVSADPKVDIDIPLD